VSRPWCLVCEGWGCERCNGGPGEQGFSADEKALLDARDRVTALEIELADLAAQRDARAAEAHALREAAVEAVEMLKRPKHAHIRAEAALSCLVGALASKPEGV
jgi:hypothetical protein